MENPKHEAHSPSPEKQHLNGYTLNSNSSSAQDLDFDEQNSDLENSERKDGESEVLTLLELCRNVHLQRLAKVDNNKDLDLNSKNEVRILLCLNL